MRPLLALAAALALAGCGEDTAITDGGRVGGETVTVHSLLPLDGPRAAAARDIVLGEKLALSQAKGQVGDLTVNFESGRLPEGDESEIAAAVRETVLDVGIVAVIGDLDHGTARVSVPLFNEAGILHVSPGATYSGFVAPVPGDVDPDAPGRWLPSGKRNFAPLLPTDGAEAEAIAAASRGDVAIEGEGSEAARALADAVARATPNVGVEEADTFVYAGYDPVNARGVVESVLEENPRARILLPHALWTTDLPEVFADERRVRFVTALAPVDDTAFAADFREAFDREPTPSAQQGWQAMRDVLAAIERAGKRAQSRQAIVDAYFESDPLKTLATLPFAVTRSR